MSASPLVVLGRWRAAELVTEVAVPLGVAGAVWTGAARLLRGAEVGPPLTTAEVTVLLGACVVVTSWAIARQVWLTGRRSAWSAILWACMACAGGVGLVRVVASSGFESACETAKGIPAVVAVEGAGRALRCQVGGLPGNPYLPGTFLRPAWDGDVSPQLGLLLAALAALSALGLRDAGVSRTGVPERVLRSLRLAPSAGPSGVIGGPSTEGTVQACGNATLWGEVCGQLYAPKKVFVHGEWCVRCQQVFRPVDRLVTLRVVSLVTADLDVLNGLERLDATAWPQGEPMPPDARLSGQERWALLGAITVPDVVTVAQLVGLIHARLTVYANAGASPSAANACAVARERASRVHAWFWTGPVLQRLTYARPTADAVFAYGPVRLRDLDVERAEDVTVQLDVGLLPLELRVGFKKTFLDEGRAPQVQNSKSNLWIPVSPAKLAKDAQGLWVPRVEGAALRTWLATERARDAEVRGATVPLPYVRTGGAPAEPAAGLLDFVRYPIAEDGLDVENVERIGASITEWQWFEPEQVQQLRCDTLVLVEA